MLVKSPSNRRQRKRFNCFRRIRKSIRLHLFSRKNETLLLRWNAFFFFDTLFDAIHFVGGLDVDFNFFASECLIR